MWNIFIAGALSAAVWPGSGQFYNREFKKGCLLVALTLLLGLSLSVAAGGEVMRALPPDVSLKDFHKMQELLRASLERRPAFFRNYSLLLGATWIFSVVDACLGAHERKKGVKI